MKAYSNTAYPKRGFTLLECVVTLVIAGFIGAVITATMAYGVRIYQGLRIQSVGTSQVHVAAAVVKREVERGALPVMQKMLTPDSESVNVVKLAVALQGSNSGEIVYEFHPLWEADK